MWPFTDEQQAALRAAYARTTSFERLERAWAFERARRAFELGPDAVEPDDGFLPDAVYRYESGDPDPDAEIEQLIADVREELNHPWAKRPPPGSAS